MEVGGGRHAKDGSISKEWEENPLSTPRLLECEGQRALKSNLGKHVFCSAQETGLIWDEMLIGCQW